MSIINDKAIAQSIDPSQLAVPGVVETIDIERIAQEMLTDLRRLDPTFSATVESDPVYKLVQVAAYREGLLRQRINDAARAVMLAYARGTDLDHLAALLGVGRLEGEDDTDMRLRTQLALEGYSTAGPIGAYTFHGRSASPEVKDIDVASPSPGEVVITVLSVQGDGTPSPDLLGTVDAALNHDDVRPLTDQVTVRAPVVIPYQVEAALYMYEGPDTQTVLEEAYSRIESYVDAQHRLGHDIAISGLHAALHIPGAVQRVALLSPAADIVVAPDEVAFNTDITLSLGGTDE
ncbi:MAG: hypothetical protein ETSY1_46790 (plasmid) [Candidatus Entotheonella factor]|uniref:Uncharacterized protein n=1 Tax=Entotheonella factor TaxID=1429438 RepID=W4M1N3_ENTF1|nr:MAG: hypothetical protein ETSY1_46790 [Candidatus Entotheonella factor]